MLENFEFGIVSVVARGSILTVTLAAVAAACTPASPGASDTDGMTTTGTTTADTDTTDPTDTGNAFPGCIEPDRRAEAAFDVDFGDWPIMGDSGSGEDGWIDVAADCTVEAVSVMSGQIGVDLLCTEDTNVDVVITISLTAPADFAVTLEVAAQVRLDAHWHGDSHLGPGEWFAIHDDADALLLAGNAQDKPSFWYNQHPTPLTVTQLEGVCELPCDNLQDCPDQSERLGLLFTHVDGPAIELLDRSRGQLSAAGREFDIIVSAALGRFCLDCLNDYVWVISADSR